MADQNPFQTCQPHIEGNQHLRTPQREGYASLAGFAGCGAAGREAAVVLPVGCGKSGLITLSPFAFRSVRTLVVAPYVKIAQQLENDFDPSNPGMFYQKCEVLQGGPFPEPVPIRGRTTNRSDLESADVAITNIDQLQGDENRWLSDLPPGFFDLILFDEGHHNVAASWQALRDRFPDARIVSFSATPTRADGRRMAGEVIYNYSVFRAIEEG